MRRFLAALPGMPIGYPVLSVAGYFLIGVFSNNHFDGTSKSA